MLCCRRQLKQANLAARQLAGSIGGGRGGGMTSPSVDTPTKRKIHRTVTGSRVDLTELENVIQSASVRDLTDVETSSVSSTRSGGGRSNIIHVNTSSSPPLYNPCIKISPPSSLFSPCSLPCLMSVCAFSCIVKDHLPCRTSIAS